MCRELDIACTAFNVFESLLWCIACVSGYIGSYVGRGVAYVRVVLNVRPKLLCTSFPHFVK